MSGRAATTDVTPGKYAIAVGIPDMPLARGWKWVRLTDVAEMATGHTPSRNHPNYWDGDIAWIGIKDARVFHARRITSTFQTVTRAGLDNSASVLLPANTVCLSRTASVGYVTIMDRPMATSQDFVNWKCSDALAPEFLMYLLIAERDSLLKFGKGTTHTTIYFPEAKALSIGLPPKGEQRRIVAKIEGLFSDLDAGVAALERVRANLKRYRAAVLKAAVEGRLTEQWHKQHGATEPAAILLERILAERRAKWEQDQLRKFKEAEKTPPKGWKEKYAPPLDAGAHDQLKSPEAWLLTSLDALLSQPLRNGHSSKRSETGAGVRTLTLTAVTYGDFSERNTKLTVARPDAVGDLWLEPGDVLIERSNTPELVGTARVYRGPRDFAIFPDLLIRGRVVSSINDRFLEIVLESRPARLFFRKRAVGTAGSMPKIDQETIQRLPIPLPPRAEQAEIVAEVDRRLSVADAAETQVEHTLQRAARLRQAILKRAFEGKLVEQDPTDEPAAALLERIKAPSNGKHPAPAKPPMRRSRARV